MRSPDRIYIHYKEDDVERLTLLQREGFYVLSTYIIGSNNVWETDRMLGVREAVARMTKAHANGAQVTHEYNDDCSRENCTDCLPF